MSLDADNLLVSKLLVEVLYRYNYEPQSGVFVWRNPTKQYIKSGDVAGATNGAGYRQLYVHRKLYLAHRLAWLVIHEVMPAQQIDHINKKRDDNRICNLRQASNKQNSENQSVRSNNSSGMPGVYWHQKNKNWVAKITHNGHQIHIGCFATIFQAANARTATAKTLFTH